MTPQITIAENIKGICPTLTLAVITADVKITESSIELKNTLNACAQIITGSTAVEKISKILSGKEAAPSTLADRTANIAALRSPYKAIGQNDLTRHRGSAEALMRRVLRGKGLYYINTIVEINNIISLDSGHSVGSYDIKNIAFPAEFRIGQQGKPTKASVKTQ